MIRFEHKEYLLLLLLIPISTALYFYVVRQTKNRLEKSGNIDLINRLMPDRNEKKSIAKFILFNLILFFLIIGFAQPQMGTKMEKIQRKGIDVMIALDVSKSMLSQDVVPSRLEKSKLLIQTLLKKLDGDRVGLVIFAGSAYMQMPLTVDYSSLMLYLKTINTNSVPTQGTIITDGEDHEENAIDKAESITSDGTKIFAIGVGSKQGGTIPEYDENGNKTGDKKDENGEPIISKLNENMLQALAKAGEGNYYILDNSKTVADFLSKDIAKMETKTINDKVFTDFVEQFQYFLAFALLLLFIDFFITYRKKIFDFKNAK